MKLKRKTISRILRVVVTALLFALVMQPASTLAEEMYTVTYELSDGNYLFEFTDPTIPATERVVAGGSPSNFTEPVPSGQDTPPFAYWTSNVDVTLTDGTAISSSWSVLTTEQIGQIVVTRDITLHAYPWFYWDMHGEKLYAHIYFSSIEHGTYSDDTYIPVDVPNTLGSRIFNMIVPDEGWELDYWTCYDPLFIYDSQTAAKNCDTTQGKWVRGNEAHYTTDEVSRATFNNATFFTPHLKKKEPEVIYTTDGNGSIKPGIAQDSEKVTYGGHATMELQPTPKSGYTFEYWTSDIDVVFTDGSSVIAGKQLKTEQLSDVVVKDNVTFKAHFKKTDADTGDPANIKPADSSAAKLLPKTSDVLPSFAGILALCSACAVGTAVALSRKYHRL